MISGVGDVLGMLQDREAGGCVSYAAANRKMFQWGCRARVRWASVVLFSGGYPWFAQADEWSLNPSLQLKTQYDDNIFLSSTSPVSTWGYSASPIFVLGNRTAASSLEMEGRLIFNAYSESSVTDPNVQTLNLRGRVNTLRSTWGIQSSIKRDTTIATVVDAQNQDQNSGDQEVNVDENLVERQVRRTQANVQPLCTFRLTETDSIRAAYRIIRTTFSDAGTAELVDYKQERAEAGLAHQLDRNNRLSVTVTASTYKAVNADTVTDNYELRTGWFHTYAEDLRGDLSFGFRTVSSTQGDEQIDSTGGVLGVSLRKQGSELTSYRLGVQRRLSPSGAGVMVQNDSLTIDYSRAITARLKFTTSANLYRNESIDFLASSVDRRYFDVEPQLSWKITRLWSLDGSYQYKWQKYSEQGVSASSNAIFLAVDYAWPTMAVSR